MSKVKYELANDILPVINSALIFAQHSLVVVFTKHSYYLYHAYS